MEEWKGDFSISKENLFSLENENDFLRLFFIAIAVCHDVNCYNDSN